MAGEKIVSYRSTGSNTAASGEGPATAVTGTSAFSGDGAGGGTQTEIDVSGDTPDLSAVQAGDILFLDVGTGNTDRHLFEITAVNDTTDIITVLTAPDTSISSGSPVSWAVGGNRLDPFYKVSQARCDMNYAEPRWGFELEAGQTYNFAEAYPSIDAKNLCIFSSDPWGTRAVADIDADFGGKWNNIHWHTIDLDLGGITTCNNMFGVGTVLMYCRVRDYGVSAITNYIGFGSGGIFYCEYDAVGNSSHACIRTVNTFTAGITVYGTSFNDCGELYVTGTSLSATISHCVFLNGVGNNTIRLDDNAGGWNINWQVTNCTIFGANGDGIEVYWAPNGSDYSVIIMNNIISDCGAYGINMNDFGTGRSNVNLPHQMLGNNLFHNNTSGNINQSTSDFVGKDDPTPADPSFTSETGGSEDLTLQSGSPAIDVGRDPAILN